MKSEMPFLGVGAVPLAEVVPRSVRGPAVRERRRVARGRPRALARSEVPGGALCGDRALRHPGRGPVADDARAPDVRGDDRRRRLVGLRRRARLAPPRRPPPQRAGADAPRDARLEPRREPLEAAQRDPLPAPVQGRRRISTCSTPASSRRSPRRSSFFERRSAGRCGSTRGRIPTRSRATCARKGIGCRGSRAAKR